MSSVRSGESMPTFFRDFDFDTSITSKEARGHRLYPSSIAVQVPLVSVKGSPASIFPTLHHCSTNNSEILLRAEDARTENASLSFITPDIRED